MRISDWSSDVCSSDLMTDDGVALVASMDDLLAHKLKAIHDRAEAKDYEDIAAILTNGHSLERGLAAREALFGSSVPAMVPLKALTKSDERSVGKEGVSTCRSRWSPYHEKKNTQ